MAESEGTARIIPREEVARHASKTDCWIVIANSVYDVTSFLDDHPGGPETVVGVAGQDATAQFEDTGHSKSARDMLKKYFIGSVPASEERTIGGSRSGSAAGGSDSGSSSLTWVAYAIPAIIVLLAVLYQYGLIGGGPAAKK